MWERIPAALKDQVMLRSTWRRTVRDLRWQVLGWGGGLAVLIVATAAALVSAYPDDAAQAQLTRDVSGSLSAAQVLFGRPANLRGLAGLVEWRGLGLFPVLLGLFLVLSATALSRGREERGELEVVLVTGGGRGRFFAEQAGGLALAFLLVCTLVWMALLLCGPATGRPVVNPAHAALSLLNFALGAALFGAFALLVAQFAATRRRAALIAGGALVAAHLWANLGLVASSLAGARWLSPLYLVGRSTPLATGHADAAALVALPALTLAQVVLAGWLFTRRDLGATASLPLPALVRRVAGHASRGMDRRRSTVLLGGALGRGLHATLGTALVWGVALSTLAVLFTAITPAITRTFATQANMSDFTERLDRGNIGSAAGFLSFGLFGFLPLLVSIGAATLAASWSAEERAGQLELELAAPLPRRHLYFARAGAVLAALAVTVALVSMLFLSTVWLAEVDLPWDRAVVAVLLLVPLAWAIAAAGFAVAGWRPGVVGAVLTPLLAVSFFFDLLAPLLNFPDALRRLSIFHLYGQPLTGGVDWLRLVVLLGMTGLFLAAGCTAFVRRDIAK